ncbi:exportin-5-like [Paramacrobiotus metropolitanus]|uniref:exportin-5-like n=1 Tax=Paramacrobiotus metropolitanus TaxID=2943436 RepID=UPI002445EFA6|nr:exportin-5-like [Paramacrobiotus metropolitanus]
MDAAAQEIQQIMRIISMMGDPSVPNAERMQAYQACEEMKKLLSSHQKTDLGFRIATSADIGANPVLRRFGLQLIEDVVKYSWNDLDQPDKVFVKDITIQLITRLGSDSVDGYISDGIAKILVEIVKREWPQHWPSMLQEVELLCAQGPNQLYVIILMFHRLVEDLLQFHSLSPARHKEVSEAFTSMLPDFIAFLVRCLQQNDHSATIGVLRVCAVLGESAQVKFLWEGEGMLFDEVFSNTINQAFCQAEVMEFLDCVLDRKYSKKEDIHMVLRLFSEDKWFSMLVKMLAYYTEQNVDDADLSKKVCSVFSLIAVKLATVPDLPVYLAQYKANFQKYVEMLLQLVQNGSPVICGLALSGWLPLWSNGVLKTQPEVQASALILLQQCSRLALIHKFSEEPWIKQEFGDQESLFREFLIGLRVKIGDIIRKISGVFPKEALDFSFGLVTSLVCKQESDKNKWSAVLTLLDGTTRNVPDDIKTSHRQGAFQLILQLTEMDKSNMKELPDAGLTSLRLSLVSKLVTAFVPNPPPQDESASLDMVVKVLDHDLLLLTSTVIDQTSNVRHEAKEDLHIHARNLFTSLSRVLTKQLLQRYDDLVNTVRRLFDPVHRLSTDDQCVLLDGLITVTKNCQDEAKKSQLIREIQAAVVPFWLSEEFCRAISSAGNFAVFFGLDKLSDTTFQDSEMVIRRNQILFCSRVIASTCMHMNCSASDLKPFLENNFSVIRCILELHSPKLTDSILRTNQTMLSLPEGEVQTVLKPVFVDYSSHKSVPVYVRRIQNWLFSVFESVCRIVGFAGRSNGGELYEIPDFRLSLENSVFHSVCAGYVPLFRVRTLVRELLAHYIRSCPTSLFHTALIPVLKLLCPVVSNILNVSWNSLDTESDEKLEILLTVLLRAFTKDYCALILQRILCDQHRASDDNSSVAEVQDTEMMEDESSDNEEGNTKPQAAKAPKKNADEISPLGLLSLQDPVVANALLMTVFNGLWWPDSELSLIFGRLAHLLIPVSVRKENILITPSGADYIIRCILAALRAHGQHEANQLILINLGLSVYYFLKPILPVEVEAGFRSDALPDPKLEQAFKQLDKMLFEKADSNNNLFAKPKREAFKRLVNSHIGKPLSQLEKVEILMPRLEPKFKNRSKNVESFGADAVNSDLNLPSLFLNQAK